MLRKSKIIVISGPTAVGKTKIGSYIAEELNSEIISVDSRQIYRYMDIGTAKPEKEELIRVKHHFIDIMDPNQRYDAGTFGRSARTVISSLIERGKIPILVGGSGMYMQAVLDGFYEDTEDYSEIRRYLNFRLKNEGKDPLWNELLKLDPVSHKNLSKNDTQRMLRALEVAIVHRSEVHNLWKRKPHTPLHCVPQVFCLTRDRKELYSIIDKRVDEMIALGLIEEVKNLLNLGYTRSSWALRTFGYDEILDFLENKCSCAEAIERIKRNTRRYAKRQLTWFRKDRRMRWLDVDTWGKGGVIERILSQIH
tara:strand:+ start:304 stop:1230 length:927 start_codon:yes stop_codon:yes gene_type:complete